ncbi:MAG: hypothetical protein K5666_02140, partial [Bacilli bacterium]|nr:hypothetical protein [Bacilli bacterium]
MIIIDKNNPESAELERADKAIIEHDMAKFGSIEEEIVKANSEFKEVGLNMELPQMGIYSSNKLVECYRYVRSKGVYCKGSVIYSSIREYILGKILEPFMEETTQLFKGIEHKSKVFSFLGFLSLRKRVNNKRMAEKLISYGDILCNLDIEKVIEEAVNYNVDDYLNSSYYAGDINK